MKQQDIKVSITDNHVHTETPYGEEVSYWPEHVDEQTHDSLDHFIVKNGVTCAGTHLIIDLWGSDKLADMQLMETAMRDAVEEAGATLLHIHLHHFTPNGGISGVAVLAESHISVHTWPERHYAAFDVFMCGDAKPEKAIGVFQRHFGPEKIDASEILRGITE